MAPGFSRATLAFLLAWIAACRDTPRPAVDADLAMCVPPETRLLAGANLEQVRANPALRILLAGWLDLLEPARDASSVLVAYTGADLFWAARGRFHPAPAGSTLLAPELAVGGPPALVRAAAAQHSARRTGAPALLAEAEPLAAHPVWAVINGNTPLPLSGNAANLNRLLALADSTTLTLGANSQILLHAAGRCQSAAQASRLEEGLRGLLTLARAGMRDRNLASLLAAVQVRRDDLTVHADLSAAPDLVARMLQAAAR